MNINILQLGTFPIKKPMHGGQRRIAALGQAYRDSGMCCQYIACYSPSNFTAEQVGEHDLPAEQNIDGNFEDLLIGERFLANPLRAAKFLAAWRRFNPQVVSFEQPYLWPIVRQLLREGKVERPKLIYSSQNVETTLKPDIYKNILPPEEMDEAVDRVRAIEQDLVRHADLVICISEAHARHFRQWGAAKCVVIRNGGEFQEPSRTAMDKWNAIFKSPYKTKRACFVGSAHMPNLTGLTEMLGPSLAFLPPECEVVVAGRVCELLYHRPLFGEEGGVNRSRLHLVWEVEDDDLAAIIKCCDVVLVPIVSGGGDNLKTVQALLSRKPIVATKFSFLTFQEFSVLPHVFLSDDPREFKRLVRKVLRDPGKVEFSTATEAKLRELTWTEIGRGAALAVRQLMAEPAAATEIRSTPLSVNPSNTIPLNA